MNKINELDVFRICISDRSQLLVNIAYTEIGEGPYEVLGAYSGSCGGGGLFHQDSDGTIFVSDDVADFDTMLNTISLISIASKLERQRAEFEVYDDEGNLLGPSTKAYNFLANFDQSQGYVEAYSEGASEDFIYDVQEKWNLSFFKS